jgi:hypothetical protein
MDSAHLWFCILQFLSLDSTYNLTSSVQQGRGYSKLFFFFYAVLNFSHVREYLKSILMTCLNHLNLLLSPRMI